MRFRSPRVTRRPYRRQDRGRGQAMVEVALILPIFIIAIFAIFEFGYWAAVGAATHSASREAARYGSTVGTVGSPAVERYRDCNGIRDAARLTSGSLIDLPDSAITVTYDDGAGTSVAVPCASSTSRPTALQIDKWDRVVVEVRYTYQPITALLRPLIGSHEIVSVDRRSIIKETSP